MTLFYINDKIILYTKFKQPNFFILFLVLSEIHQINNFGERDVTENPLIVLNIKI